MEKPSATADSLSLPRVSLAVTQALANWADQHLRQLPTPHEPVVVALSGGADSVALLMAAQHRWPGSVMAFHVNHGLQSAAAEFESVCAALCRALVIPFESARVNITVRAGDSPEAEARRVRYAALASAASRHHAPAVLLGQHADDQAETVVLAMTRGAGIPGLAAMAAATDKLGVLFGRPFLALRSATLRSWVIETGVVFVDDPSNRDLRFTRNRIRHQVMPVISAQFPAFVETIGRTARHAAEAANLLHEVAQADLEALGEPPSIFGLRQLTEGRRANVLRLWVKRCAGRAPSTVQLDELQRQLQSCTTRGHAISIKVAGGKVCRDGGVLRYQSEF